MDETPQPRITLVVGILGLIIVIVLDLLSLVPFVGDIEEIPVGLAFLLSFVFGAGSPIMITIGIVMALKAIPAIQGFPLWTIGWCVIWYTENHRSVATTVIEGVAKAEVGAEAGEGLGEVGAAGEAAEGATATAEAGAETAEAVGREGGAAGETAGQKPQQAETSADKGDTQKEAAEKSERREETPSETTEPSLEEEGEAEEDGEQNEEQEKKDEAERAMETKEEGSPLENLGDELLEELPQPEKTGEDEDDADDEEGYEETPPKPPTFIDQNKKAQQVKESLNRPKAPKIVTGDQDQDSLPKAT